MLKWKLIDRSKNSENIILVNKAIYSKSVSDSRVRTFIALVTKDCVKGRYF